MTQPSRLPPPPPPPPQHAGVPADGVLGLRAPRPGELTAGWTWVLALAWIGVVVGFVSVWKASRELGLPTWWLGPIADQRPLYVTMLPFLAPAAVVLLTFTRSRFAPWAGLGAGVVTAAIAVGDLGRFNGFGVVELVVAAAGTAVTVATFAGRYRVGEGTSGHACQ